MKTKVFSVLLVGLILTMLILAGPAQGFILSLTIDNTSPKKGETVTLTTQIELQEIDQHLPIKELTLKLTGPEELIYTFDLNGNLLSPPQDPECAECDLNSDNKVDVVDMARANRRVEFIRSMNGCNINKTECNESDLNTDGKVDVTDFALARRNANKIETMNGCEGISIKRISNQLSYSYGYGYGYDQESNTTHNFGYGYGYNYGSTLTYQVTLHTDNLKTGKYQTELNVLIGEKTFTKHGDDLTILPDSIQIKINEFVSDAVGAESDNEWIELYNSGENEINLDGWTIEDNQYTKQLDGLTIPAYGFLVLMGTDFTLSLRNNGDILILKNLGTEIDKVAYGDFDDGDDGDNAPKSAEGQSCGRNPDGKDTDTDNEDFKVFATPTKGITNNP